MSTKYKFQSHQSGIYFISFAVVYWIDVFVRAAYRNEIVASLKYCQENKGLTFIGLDNYAEPSANNPVVGGFVKEPVDWLYSSAIDYLRGKGILEVNLIV